jgi:hypothetical protein
MRLLIFLMTMLLLTACGASGIIGQNFDQVLINPSQAYDILYEDSLYDYYERPTRITADLFVDDCSSLRQMCEIKFSEAKLEKDTLHIEIFETNSLLDYHYKIKVVDGYFRINYWYQTTLDSSIREIKTIEQRLVLDKGRFKKGEVIKGHTEYIGQCIKGCNDAEMKPIHITGNFKATVK